ncbi:MAG: SpaA isopeptide-forming pilin-related protein [Actinomycetota bacterium]|nr:SpaA isopeptide-forming pilin-related protein [Actinomycetota bacterium]
MFGRSNNRVSTSRNWRSKTALLATLVVAASVVSTGQAVASLPGFADIVVHAGGVRTGTSAVSGLGGAVFQAVRVGGGSALTCTTNAAGTCTITVPTGLTSSTRLAYDVSESVAPAGWYLNPNLDYGSSTTGTPTAYRFRTNPLVSTTSVDVPGAVNDASYNDAVSPGRPFTGLLSTSRNNPIAPTACGLKIALILDQSGSMSAGTKQADLKLAAKKVITTLTGTPSQMAIYTFAAGTGGSVPLTTLGSSAEAAPLTNFVNGLPTPSGGTNWDQGFAQAVTATKAYDLVVVLTDGNPTLDHTGSGNSSTTNFHNVDNGIYSANAIKNLGSRLVAIGIGVNGGQDNLRAISGPTVNSDYYLGTTGNFDDVFKSLATGNCEGTITVQKNIQDFRGNDITNSPAANGWNFAGTVSSPAANLTFPPTATVNGATGFTQTTVTIPAGGTPTVTITETLSAGYTFVGAVCSVNGTAATTAAAGNAGHPGVSFTAAAAAALACTFTNKQAPPTSSLAVQKLDSTTSLPVPGATFQLYRENTVGTRNPAADLAVGSPCVTAGSPAQCVSAATLTFGTYYWVETGAPTGYVLPVGTAAYSAAFTIDAAHTGTPAATVTVADAQILSSLAITKLDAITDVALPGATFQLYREAVPGTQSPGSDTALGATCTTAGTPAKCVSAATLTFGTYYWVETAAPTGYLLPAAGPARNSAAYTIDATHTGTPAATLSVSDTQLTSSLAIKKLDGTSGQPVAGAKFQLYREAVAGTQNPASDISVGAACTTAGSPAQCESAATLPFGTYYWVETVAPAGYVLPSGIAAYSAAYTLDAAHTGAPAATVSVTDARTLSSLAVRKLDGTTNLPVAGATFMLYREATVGTQNPALDTALAPCTTSGSPGACASNQTLTFGTYYWVETSAPAGYVLPTGSNAYTAATTIDATHTGSPVATVSVTDAQTLSSLAVRKVDAATQLPVANATFKLYREAVVGTQNPGADTALGTCTTSGSPAQCSSAGLTFGTYYWVETVAPAGYVLPTGSNAYSNETTIDAAYAEAGSSATVTVTDAQLVSGLAVRKLDGTTNAPVPGATFQLYRETTAGTQNPSADTALGTCTTAGSPAQCSTAGLTFGTYYWVETVAPTGYVLPASPADQSAPTTIDAAYAAAGITATVSVNDAQILSTLAVQKLDATTSGTVDGATFQLYREVAPGTRNPAVDATIGAPCTTTAGSCSQSGLIFGTYYWVETAAPTGYLLPTGTAAYTVATTINAASAATGLTSTLSVADAQVLSSLSVRKTDESSTALAGATFELWRAATPDVLIGQCTTGALGTCSLGDLTFGTYYWVEISPPPFYELPDNPVSASIVVGPDTAGTTIPATSFADPATPVATVTKTVQSTTQNADGSWTISYDVAVTNPSAKYATTYGLVDTLEFGSGIHVVSAVVTGPAGVTLASPAWNGSTEPVVVAGQQLAPSTTDHYAAVVVATVDADANRTCDTGGGFGNTSSVSLQAGQPVNVVRAAALLADAGQSASACSEPVSPAIAKTFVSAVQHLVGGVWDGSVDVTYTVSVNNPSASTGLVYSLSDSPAFPADVTINGGTVTGTDGTAPITVTPGWNGTTGTVIVTARALPANGTDTYTVVVNATVPVDVDEAELPCTDGGSGTGFDNAATATSGSDTFTANACGPIPSLTAPSITKTVIGSEQNADGSWTVSYDLAVANNDPMLATQYNLSDVLAFGNGITIDTATVTGPADAAINPGWDGVGDVGIVTSRIIGAATTEHYTVTVSATVTGSATTTDRDCTLSADEEGTGFLNAAVLTLGMQGSDSTACAAPGLPTVAKTVLSVNPGSSQDSWIVTYAITVANATSANVTYGLSDVPGLAAGTEITGASASWINSALNGSAPSAATDVAGWTGVVPADVLATAQVLPAGSKDTYTVILDVTAPNDIAENLLECSSAGSGHGYFNAAVMTAGADSFPVTACAPITISGTEGTVITPPLTTRPVAPQSGPLAFTGVQVWQLMWTAIALLIGGVALLALIGRRRPRAGDVR